MILSDSQIIKKIKKDNLCVTIDKYDIVQQVWPASLDFRLWSEFKYYDKQSLNCLDPKSSSFKQNIKTCKVKNWDAFILHPGQFVLWTTIETLDIPSDLVARCEWRSSLGRLGLIIHSTAGFIDPWFKGCITLEITNINEIPVKLYPGMRVGQFAFELIDWEVQKPYNLRNSSKYMNQNTVVESRIYDDEY